MSAPRINPECRGIVTLHCFLRGPRCDVCGQVDVLDFGVEGALRTGWLRSLGDSYGLTAFGQRWLLTALYSRGKL